VEKKGRPNILLVHTHDLGTWLGCYGDATIATPRLDAFAAEAVRFDQAFSTAPLCSPARGSLFTGLYPHQHGLTALVHRGGAYRAGTETLPMQLGRAGYHTALIGLQHEAVDSRTLGFAEITGEGYLPRALVVAETTERWLSADRDEERPFFLTVGMWETHRPWPPEDYRPADPATVGVPSWLPDNDFTRRDLAAFHGSIRQADRAVGRILDALQATGLDEDTLVIFTTDHGAAFPRAKGSLYDPGVHVALLARPPRAWNVPPCVHTGLISHVDVHATLLDLAGVPAASEGISFLPVLRGEPSTQERLTVYAEKVEHDTYDPIQAVRTSRWKYIRNLADGPALVLSGDLETSITRQGYGDDHLAPRAAEELYDLAVDPDERTNLAAAPEHRGTRERLAAELDAWLAGTTPPDAASRVAGRTS
jgi:arylsulfatase A-like enzyme